MRRVPPAAGPVKAGSALWLLHSEGNPLFLLVHLQHPDGDDVAHGAHLGGVLHPAALPELGVLLSLPLLETLLRTVTEVLS